jgi:hypothetical protein
MRFLILVWCLMASPVLAQAVVVKSGEHAGFTRLVLEVPGVADWQLGRTDDGYALRLPGPPRRFDLSQVYRLIGRDRLSAIWVAPENGDLRLGVGCACHALPFEFRPGVIVIDLRDGAAPEGSSFEQALDGAAEAPLAQRPPSRPRARPTEAYDWRRLADAAPPPASSAEAPDLMVMRDSLLKQLSQGAAQGVVEMTDTLPPRRPAAPLDQVHIGPAPGFDLAGASPRSMTGSGMTCLTEADLDFRHWGDDRPVTDQIAAAKEGLIGEFDTPNPDAAARAVRFHLYLGFGAEARQILKVFGAAQTDSALWQALADILDKGQTTTDALAGMEVCDTPAALWAVLAHPVIPSGMQPNIPAIMRSFSALPPHLRRHIGPPLAERFLARGEAETARAIRDAILRVGTEAGPGVRLMEAQIDLAQGKTEAGAAVLQELATESGPMTPEALVAWVETLVSQGKPVEAATVTALAALLREHHGSSLEPALMRAHQLALAASGDFDAAFAAGKTADDVAALIWDRLAQEGGDSALLAHAVLDEAAPRPAVGSATARRLAERLTGLGLGAAALRWLDLPPGNPAEAADDMRLLAAGAELRRGDARATLRLLAGLDQEQAVPLRAAAQAQRDQPIAAAESFASIGDQEAQRMMARRAFAWPQVVQNDGAAWKAAATLVLPGPSAPVADQAPLAGPLARGRMTVAESQAARAALAELLAQTAVLAPSG